MSGFGGRFQKLVEAGQRFQQQAEEMQRQAMAMHEQSLAHPDGGDPADVTLQLDPATWMLPPSAYVKRSACTSCGATKQLPTVREYLYCDFCGQLTDFDLRRAGEAALRNPSSATFATATNALAPKAEKARKSGDRHGFTELQTAMHQARVDLAPWSVPPRAWRDDRYRRDWIDHSVGLTVLAAFDKAQKSYADQVRKRSLRLQWKGGLGLGVLGGMVATVRRIASTGLDMSTMTPKVEMSSFWPLAEVVLEQSEHLFGLARAEGLSERDPDQSSPVLAQRMTRSMLAQGWLTHMEEEDGLAFIEWLGLAHEYQHAEAHGELRHCGSCGHDLRALPGAAVVVCDCCGRRVDVSTPQVTCTGCNAQVCFLDGATHSSCPYCKTELRRT